MNKINFLAFGVAMGVLAFAASPSFAADVDVDASITTKAAVALTKNTMLRTQAQSNWVRTVTLVWQQVQQV